MAPHIYAHVVPKTSSVPPTLNHTVKIKSDVHPNLYRGPPKTETHNFQRTRERRKEREEERTLCSTLYKCLPNSPRHALRARLASRSLLSSAYPCQNTRKLYAGNFWCRTSTQNTRDKNTPLSQSQNQSAWRRLQRLTETQGQGGPAACVLRCTAKKEVLFWALYYVVCGVSFSFSSPSLRLQSNWQCCLKIDFFSEKKRACSVFFT